MGNKKNLIPSFRERRRELMLRKLEGKPPQGCYGCAFFYVVQRGNGPPARYPPEGTPFYVGCALGAHPELPMRYTPTESWPDGPAPCKAPWYGPIKDRFSMPRIDFTGALFRPNTKLEKKLGNKALANAQKHFDFSGPEPRLVKTK